MPYWIIGGLLLMSASVFAASRSGIFPAGRTKALPGDVSVSKMLGMSRPDVELMLDDIETAEEPEPMYGAMCYEMVAGPLVIEYICPLCGDKTVYEDYGTISLVEQLEADRDMFAGIDSLTELDMRLDESRFCHFCAEDGSEPALVLIVELEDQPPCSTEVTGHDLRLLRGFLAGNDVYETWNDGVMPLKPHLDRIRKLLGLPEED